MNLSNRALNLYGSKLVTLAKVVAAVCVAVLVFGLFAPAAHAQTPPNMTFVASVTNANGSLSTVLTWTSTPAATSCNASGHSTWTGTKGGSGTATLPAITLSGTYTITLACAWPTDNQVVISWVAPTRNTDGGALAVCAAGVTSGPCLAGYRIYRRVNSTDMNGAEMTPVTGGATLTHTFTNLVAGTHNFAGEAVNADGVPSALTPLVSKVITASASATRSITLTVNPVPNAPTEFK